LKLLNVDAVLLDFDGTVIDSYPGIQQAFDEAYFLTYSVANELSIQSFIGPPIDRILVNVNNETSAEKVALFVTFFKNRYDTECYKSSVLYDGLKELLQQLFEKGIKLFIVTNKREKATRLITNYLEIDHFFSGYYCSDSKENYTSKSDIVKDVLEVEKLDSSKSVLVGDTEQDQISAQHNNIPFVYAAYGYGNLQKIERTVQTPLEILNFIEL
jgi:phosphoglycolate phosphatase